MTATIAVIMPAYGAQGTIVPAAKSLLAQTYSDWELVVVSDDGEDYEAVLRRAGLTDPRFRFLASEHLKSGASRARNTGLDALSTPYAAILDADDQFKPQKLARSVAALEHYAIVSTAIDVVDERFTHLRHIGAGPDRQLTPATHKWVNFSMDSMIAWDRRKTDARYDPALPNMTDLDFLIKLYANVAASFHLGEPLHDYVKMPVSMSNGPGVTERMIAAKTLIRDRLAAGSYGLASGEGEGLCAFLDISIEAERAYPDALAKTPGLLFEDHIEPRLPAGR